MRYIVIVFLCLSFFACGKEGPQGAQGMQGLPGATGPMGPQGYNCSVAQTTTGATIYCPDASTASLTNGVNATSVTTVQFCPGYTPKYPTTFPEIGLCVDDTLYAVYWDGKNSWLTEVLAGTYDSTATGAPCTFTVKDNCEVSN